MSGCGRSRLYINPGDAADAADEARGRGELEHLICLAVAPHCPPHTDTHARNSANTHVMFIYTAVSRRRHLCRTQWFACRASRVAVVSPALAPPLTFCIRDAPKLATSRALGGGSIFLDRILPFLRSMSVVSLGEATFLRTQWK